MGCFLEIVNNRKLVWTSALLPDYRPVALPENGPGLLFTGVILIEPYQGGTKYTAIAMHSNSESCKTHKEMGFEQGWGKALDQLVELVKTF